jgi:hypothetical protein
VISVRIKLLARLKEQVCSRAVKRLKLCSSTQLVPADLCKLGIRIFVPFCNGRNSHHLDVHKRAPKVRRAWFHLELLHWDQAVDMTPRQGSLSGVIICPAFRTVDSG